ncbi:MAG: hypothetical protein ACLQGU_12430 [bacterium]
MLKKNSYQKKTGGVFLWTLPGSSTAANDLRDVRKEKRCLRNRVNRFNPKIESKFMSSEDNAEDMRGVPSSGRESYVFQANKPRGLLGVHADLMEKALRPEEGLLYLLYAPIWPEKKGPFGLYATPASHAMAVRKYRFIISENRHMKGIAPTIQSIPFDQVLYVQLGSALSLGWFAIQFVENEKPFCSTLFFTVTGMEHFETVIRKYRRVTGANDDRFPKKIDWVNVWRRTPMTQVDRLRSLVLKEELPFSMLRSSELWILRKRRWKSIPACLSTNGILVSTNFGIIHATDEPCVRPKIFSFGVNVSCIPFDALKSTRIIQKWIYGSHLYVLRLEMGSGPVIADYDLPFDGNCSNDAENLVRLLAWNMTAEREACIL